MTQRMWAPLVLLWVSLRPKTCEVKVSVSEKEIEILWTGHYLLAGADNEAQQLHVVSVW